MAHHYDQPSPVVSGLVFYGGAADSMNSSQFREQSTASTFPPFPADVSFASSARWIWGNPVDAAYFPSNTYWMFRRDVDIVSTPGVAQLLITASTRYQIWINGIFVGEGPAPGTRNLHMIDQHQVANFLRVGRNQLAVLVHHAGVPTFNFDNGPGGLLLQLTYNDTMIVSDGSWLAARADEWSPFAG